ncbi:MAG: SLC13 family permease, partial [Planctomycetota bacterium]
MTGRLRYMLAAAFVALYLLIPAPSSQEDRDYLAFLTTRAWLMGDDSPFGAALQDDQLAPLEVDLVPPSEDPDLQAERMADYQRSASEWVTAQQADGSNVQFDPSLPPLRLEVVVGADGVLATLGNAAGEIAGSNEVLHPGRTSLLPAFLAIFLAILTAKIIPSLLLGAMAGAYAFAATTSSGFFGFAWGGFERFSTVTVPGVLSDSFYLEILGFILFLFMSVGVMTRSGGIQGMVNWVSGFARGPVRSQLCTWIIGLLIFFDDYANCIIAGTTMRPITDRNRVSREKLSYIVDSTAAPIAGVSIFSTWVAYEVSQFRSQLPEVNHADGTPYTATEGFAVKLATLPFRFYCLFTLVMVFLTIVMRREWGPMLTAERRANLENKPIADDAQPMISKELSDLEAPEGAPQRGVNAFLPLAILVGVTVVGIYYLGAYGADGSYHVPDDVTGFLDRSLWILGQSASQRALMWGSAFALALAVLLATSQRILSFGQTMMSAVRSARSLIFAAVILILAWSLAATCSDLGTAYFLTAAFQDAFDPRFLPLLMFALS